MGILGSFLGKDQRKDLAYAKQQSDAALKEGYDSAYGDYTSAEGMYQPYAQSGQQANQFYNDALGLNGDPARTTAYNTLTSNPMFQGQLGQDSNAMARLLNAQGASGGGKAQLAAQRVFQQTAGNWLDRYRDQGAQGLGATNAMATARLGRGDLAYGYGATRAGQETNFGNAMAASRGIGVNNLINLYGTAAKAATAAATASDIRLKRDIHRVGTTPAGLPLYRFKYITGDNEHVGVMAHEAREIFPEAVFEAPNGYLMVDYARIG